MDCNRWRQTDRRLKRQEPIKRSGAKIILMLLACKVCWVDFPLRQTNYGEPEPLPGKHYIGYGSWCQTIL